MEQYTNRTSSSTSVVLSAADFRSHARIDTNAEDALLEAYIEAATRATEEQTGLQLREESFSLYASGFPCTGRIYLNKRPIQSVEGVFYTTEDGTEHELEDFALIAAPSPYIVSAYGTSFPSARCFPGSVRVDFIAGDEDEYPSQAVQAVRMLVAHWYKTRESVSELTLKDVPQAYHWLCNQLRLGVL